MSVVSSPDKIVLFHRNTRQSSRFSSNRVDRNTECRWMEVFPFRNLIHIEITSREWKCEKLLHKSEAIFLLEFHNKSESISYKRWITSVSNDQTMCIQFANYVKLASIQSIKREKKFRKVLGNCSDKSEKIYDFFSGAVKRFIVSKWQKQNWIRPYMQWMAQIIDCQKW